MTRTVRFHNKTRGGCLTCKARKVKCDEAKPACRRCSSTGRKCQGYLSSPARSQSPSDGPSPQAGLSSSPHTALFSSAAERRSFHYFQTHASALLGGNFHPSFWSREVMHCAIRYPAIRHLVVALGADYARYEAALDTRDERAAFSLEQSNRSIQYLITATRTQPADPDQEAERVYCILTASILFMYLSTIRGNNAEAIKHTESAIRILQTFERSTAAHHCPPNFPVPFKHLRALLLSMYGQLRSIINDTALEAVGNNDILAVPIKPATIFLSVSEAHDYIQNTLFFNTLAFLQDSSMRPPQSCPDPTARLMEIVSRHRELCQALQSSQNALDALVTSLSPPSRPGSPPPPSSPSSDALSILRIHHIITRAWLQIDILKPDQRECAFDTLESDLEEMLSLCETVILSETRAHGASKPPPRCKSGLGYVMPLHSVAARCRNPELRRKAIKLLWDCKRRDGLWDSRAAAMISTQTVLIEEEEMLRGTGLAGGGGVDMGRVKDDGRVREVKLELQGDNGALLRFVVAGREEVRKQVQW